MAGESGWEGYRERARLERLLRLDAEERRQVGRALARRGERGWTPNGALHGIRRGSDAAFALQELLIAAAGGRARAEEIIRAHPRFQDEIGRPPSVFPVDGRIGPRTRHLLQHLRNSDAIRDLQARLQEAGLYRGPIDGIPGPLTVGALAQAYGSNEELQRVFGAPRAPPPLSEERLEELRREAELFREPSLAPADEGQEARARLARAVAELRAPGASAPTARLLRPGDGREVVRIGGVVLSRPLAEELRRPGRLEELVGEAVRNLPANAPAGRLLDALVGIRGFQIFDPEALRAAVAAVQRTVQGESRVNPAVEIPARQLAMLTLDRLMGGTPLQAHAVIAGALTSPHAAPEVAPGTPEVVPRSVRTIPFDRSSAGSTPDWQALAAMTAEEGGRRLRALRAAQAQREREADRRQSDANAEAIARSMEDFGPAPASLFSATVTPPVVTSGALPPPMTLGAAPSAPPSAGALTAEQMRWLMALRQPPRGPDGAPIHVGLSAGHHWTHYRHVVTSGPGRPEVHGRGIRVPSRQRIHVHRSFFDFLAGRDGPHSYQQIFFGNTTPPPDRTGVSSVAATVGERPVNYALFNVIREMYAIGGYRVTGEQTEDRTGSEIDLSHIRPRLGRMSAGERPRLWTSLHVDYSSGNATGATVVPYEPRGSGADPRPGEALAAMIRALGRQGDRGGPGRVRAGLGGARVFHRDLGIGSLCRRLNIPFNLLEVGFGREHTAMLGRSLADPTNPLHIAALAVSAYTDMRLIPGMTQEQAIANARVRLAAVLARHRIPISDPAMIAAVRATEQAGAIASPPAPPVAPTGQPRAEAVPPIGAGPAVVRVGYAELAPPSLGLTPAPAGGTARPAAEAQTPAAEDPPPPPPAAVAAAAPPLAPPAA